MNMDKKDNKSKAKNFNGSWPDPVELKEMRDKFTYPDGDISNIVAPPNANEIELFKIKICHLIDGYRIEKQLKKKEVAKLLGIDESRMSEMMNGKIENYTIERLYGYLKTLNPDYAIKIQHTGD